MSSVTRSPLNTSQGDAYFVNIANLWPQYHILDASGNPIDVTGLSNSNPYPPGALFLRDMGKSIRVPGQTINATWSTGNAPGSGLPAGQRNLRKVQMVMPQAATPGPFPVTNGFVNFNEGVGGSADSDTGSLPSGYATFYIDLNDLDDSNPTVPKCRFARLSIQ
jgi:hypothetical protein